MKSKTNSEDLWKKYNEKCRTNPALCNKINTDPVIIGLLVALSGYLQSVPNAPVNIVKQLTTAAPMPHALYFGVPCPFHIRPQAKPNEWQVAFERALQWFDTGVDIITGAAELSVLEKSFATCNTLLTLSYTKFLEGHAPRSIALCAAWRILCSALRERVWTIIRASELVAATSSFRST